MLGMTVEKCVENGTSLAKGTISSLCGMDLSNFVTARNLMSEETVGKLDSQDTGAQVDLGYRQSPVREY